MDQLFILLKISFKYIFIIFIYKNLNFSIILIIRKKIKDLYITIT